MDEETNETGKTLSDNLFWVVGIGASSGGLDAFKQLIKAIPVDSGMAYILVQHLDPTHQSILSELLQKITAIPIHEITDNVKVEPNNIYVIPSNKLLTANDGILNLTVRPKTLSMSIDLFFKSLAEVHQSQAIGVVLSGTGKDGTLGLKAIKELGGITFAQQLQTAAYDQMPQSAIDAEVVDFILSPEEIIQHLLTLSKQFRENPSDENAAELKPEDTFLKQILALIETRKGVDFSHYKPSTIRRRVARRMLLENQTKIEDYYNFLKDNAIGIDTLFQDILIPVTAFFRDTHTFDALCETVIPALVINKSVNDTFRIWIVGCSTGQEVYTIAICLYEFFETRVDKVRIQIFATDISDIAIAKARTGLYSRSEVENISEVRLKKFFRKADGGFQIIKSIREMCVFASHNILANPPFADIDLISCRNVLIYMDTFLQRKAMTAFHYALKEKGMLMLGKSESVGNSTDLFAVSSEFDKIYTRKSVPGRFIHVLTKRRTESLLNEAPKEKISNDDFIKNADDVVLSKSPGGVVVNDEMDIVQFRGATSDWLESPPGKPSLSILKMVKRELVLDLRNALNKAKSSGRPFSKEGVSLTCKDHKKLVTIEVTPLLNTINTYFLILFKNTDIIPDVKANKRGAKKVKTNGHEILVGQLEKEIFQTREDMRIITEDHEAGNEELLSSNEELLSNTEELRSLNEELEISKEELQSTVEELSASNQELAVSNEQLNHSRKYAEAIITTIREPLVVLDKDLRIKSANSSFYKAFKQTERETENKLFYELDNHQWDIPDLRNLFEKILEGKTFYDSYELKQKFSVLGERTMVLNVRKISSEDNNEQLILLAIEDITEKKTIDERLKKNAEYVKAILESSPQITSTTSADGAVTYFNQFFLDYAGLTLTEAIAWGWQSVLHPDMLEDFKKAWTKSLSTGEAFYKEVQLKRHDGIYRWHISRAIPILHDNGMITSWVGTTSDIHDQKMFSKELEQKVKERTQLLKETNIDLEHSNKNLEQFAFIASHDLQEPLRKIKTFSNMLSDKYSDKLPNEANVLLDKIHASSDRMSILIHDVLNFSRIENIKNIFVITSLSDILTNVLTDFNLLITEKNATIDQTALPAIEAVPHQINQLFYNLLSNALKFIRKDVNPIISITARDLTATEVSKYPSLNKKVLYTEIIFEDNGIGFEQGFNEKIFLIFQRLHAAHNYPGTGIGLALCKKIVVNHHGEIFAEGRENVGSSFHIILPYKQPSSNL